jgi:hypothetical protein
MRNSASNQAAAIIEANEMTARILVATVLLGILAIVPLAAAAVASFTKFNVESDAFGWLVVFILPALGLAAAMGLRWMSPTKPVQTASLVVAYMNLAIPATWLVVTLLVLAADWRPG